MSFVLNETAIAGVMSTSTAVSLRPIRYSENVNQLGVQHAVLVSTHYNEDSMLSRHKHCTMYELKYLRI